MTFQSLLKRASLRVTHACQLLVALAVAAVPGVALAELPTLEEPTQGAGGIRTTAQGYLYDGFVLAGLLLSTAAFIWVGIGCLAAFNEGRARGEWTKFGVTAFVGVVLILVVIWLSTEAAPILAQ
ncbi:TIGR03745 family integrating conjugative element membrane protein [Halomonas sp. McH1-25]|uniref:TIGR03745 family integrating conjugative element membrane protein n=1 Tax=unclassified Halomonas TaxID=2609666 RepID=UPI001EF52096|nr:MULTISPECIES: TIGR03745 family integrating conjugative element membrane protein [unclassified Halomonas]MCG7601780.1 TIGR03745 family integrating conjugative element membrane protein [Halomonas sp. McH1-25]MCP1343956.1 TIGR03745 family integrating conjugative element membrane protein [Halomonas sp. FL8]MCP1361811.1 TIGR03745 family integrating conjugative element membrane protein [Halomonas sp. BBD45]MCP1366570.1 TIGR03745 family integrating conjugative element membrane protein [Halomonas sp